MCFLGVVFFLRPLLWHAFILVFSAGVRRADSNEYIIFGLITESNTNMMIQNAEEDDEDNDDDASIKKAVGNHN